MLIKYYNAAIDIGTTTIVIKLLNENGEAEAEYVSLNPQRKYGADILTRVRAANTGKGNIMRQLIIDELIKGLINCLERLSPMIALEKTGRIKKAADKIELSNMVVCGNTTMMHFLLKLSCEGLGQYPFVPELLEYDEKIPDLEEGLKKHPFLENAMVNCKTYIFPGVSAFIGGDIVAGMYACGMDFLSENVIFIDIGTNGEMVIAGPDRILAASAAAGPAFEGGGIIWGIGSIPGAICGAFTYGKTIHVRTIGNKPPCGICGTGLIDIVAALADEKIINSDGLLSDDYFDYGFDITRTAKGEQIRISQSDIHNLQLAKAAIRAGIEILMERYGADYNAISKVFIAGSFGQHIDARKAARIGLLPNKLVERMVSSGNTALSGCIKKIYDEESNSKIKKIMKLTKNISLAEEADFSDKYIGYMKFGNGEN